jgi:glycopeptide antibiotics resistance protein
MRNPTIQSLPDTSASSWSNRILLLATAGILFLTLYPFRFNFHVLPNGAWPFLLGRSLKRGSRLDVLLNILLFVPFGFGLSEKLQEKGKSRRFTLMVGLAAGALFSYTIEFLQLYIPERDSGWEDVFTNGSGSLIGSFIFIVAGGPLVLALTNVQHALIRAMKGKRIVVAALIYFCAWAGVAAVLEKQARLSDWTPPARLVLGNDISGRYPWRGEIQTLQLWDRPLTREQADVSGAATNPSARAPFPVLRYDFSSAAGALDSGGSPNLIWIPKPPPYINTEGLTLDGRSWMATQTDLGNVTQSLLKTNQFTIHIVCGATDRQSKGPIVSISNGKGQTDLILRQDNAGMVFWFRTPLSSKVAQLAWNFPQVFVDHRMHDILYSYDGSELILTLDGKKEDLIYKLGPGASLARIVHLDTAELEGYNYIFYALVFCVGGAMLGLFEERYDKRSFTRRFVRILLSVAFSAALLEIILDAVSGRGFSVGAVVFSLLLSTAGLVWSKSDETFVANERPGIGMAAL